MKHTRRLLLLIDMTLVLALVPVHGVYCKCWCCANPHSCHFGAPGCAACTAAYVGIAQSDFSVVCGANAKCVDACAAAFPACHFDPGTGEALPFCTLDKPTDNPDIHLPRYMFFSAAVHGTTDATCGTAVSAMLRNPRTALHHQYLFLTFCTSFAL
jgi:hypothetical protein